MNFQMNKIECTLLELISMLRTMEANFDSERAKAPIMHHAYSSRAAPRKGSIGHSHSKGKASLKLVKMKGKGKKKKKKKAKALKASGSVDKERMKKLAKEKVCFNYGNKGYWKKDYVALLNSISTNQP
ncbi:hypothetical protein CFOL_v3_04315 [Cephalotus follicularis]|uniref:Uncharacterized protein n=1 Tax=Cephalotus follicularis TaxID=3775 RepID=A0A1Q3AYF2_CEPFO|nr:hypothetical protein CFOL_v3_04315 [Cephalotus follicularis]